MSVETTHYQGPTMNFSRRDWLRNISAGFGFTAFAGLAAETAAEESNGPLAVKAPHFAARAKRVIFLCMRGGPSHLDTFDPKPKLAADHGKPGLNGRHTKLLASPWKFRPQGNSGLEISELFPELARHADKLCMLRGMHTDNENHSQALEQLHTGSFQFIRPSLGAWTLYGLGTENQSLPGFISICPLTQLGGVRYYGSGFLPAACSATLIGDANRRDGPLVVGNLANRDRKADEQRRRLDLMQSMNRDFSAATTDPRIEGLIESYELAFRMQDAVPRVMDLAGETQATLNLYGADQSFGKQCLLARRFAEAGVRFIEITDTDWDHHGFLTNGMTQNCGRIDKPIAGLLADLDQRGLLNDTLVVWGGEFGRTPDDIGTDGRNHNNKGYSMWLAGGGVRGGHVHGATDDYGYEAVAGKVHTHDLHATLLHILGLDHERLTFRYAGRDFRLTDVHGTVVREILA